MAHNFKSALDLDPQNPYQEVAAAFARGVATTISALTPYLPVIFKPAIQVDEATVFALRDMIKGTPGDLIAYEAELAECRFVCELPF